MLLLGELAIGRLDGGLAGLAGHIQDAIGVLHALPLSPMGRRRKIHARAPAALRLDNAAAEIGVPPCPPP
jgi:hypothetical protein